MAQKQVWENEWAKRSLVTGGAVPSRDTRDYGRYLRKEKKLNFNDLTVLDLGSGVGKNGNYFASLGSTVKGLEIAHNAVLEAQKRASEHELPALYYPHDIGTIYPFEDDYFDVALDVVSSNSLTENERDMYIKETYRVLKNDGLFFVKALSKDGDKNAQTLLKTSPGKEKDTYVMPELSLYERVFTEKDITALYAPYFIIEKIKKKTNYSRLSGRVYKRNYWVLYMKKRGA